MIQASDPIRHVRPARQLPRQFEIFVGIAIGRHAHLGETLEHDQRIMRPAAERLCAREQIHQRRIFRRTGLDGAPCEVVKRLIVAAIRRGKRELATVAPFTTAAISRRLSRGWRLRNRRRRCRRQHNADDDRYPHGWPAESVDHVASKSYRCREPSSERRDVGVSCVPDGKRRGGRHRRVSAMGARAPFGC